jgi:hypothetical protein
MGDGIISPGEHDHIAGTGSQRNRLTDALIQGLGAFGIYLALSFLFFGRALIGHFSDRFIGRDADPTQMMWLLAWWPYALGHHLNPFLTDYVWAPVGFNFAVMTSIPLPAILAAPLTRTIGVVATFNLLMLSTAPLAAISAFALCRRITHSFWPSMLGGFVFGFSSYMLGQTLNHFCVLLVFPVPLAAYLIVRWFERSIKGNTLVALMTALLVAQFLIDPEQFTTATLVGAIVLGAALHYSQAEARRHLWQLTGLIAASFAFATIVLIPYLYYFFAFGTLHQVFWPAEKYSIDLLNLLIPTEANLLGAAKSLSRVTSHWSGTVAESDGFIAVPLIAIMIVWARRHWSEPFGKTIAVSSAIVLVAALGPYLKIGGHPTAPMPWLAIEHLPLIEHALPARLMLFPPLALGLVAAMWLRESAFRSEVKAAVVVLVVAMMLPNLSASYWTTQVDTPQFFTDGSAQRYLSRSDIVLTLPWGARGQSMLWQAQCGMCFRNVSGWTGVDRFEIRRWPIVNYFLDSHDLVEPELQLKAFLANNGVTAVAVDDANPYATRWKTLLATVNVDARDISGVSLYKLSSGLLADYRTPEYSGVEMERRAVQGRFAALVTATDEYLQSGGDPGRLSDERLIYLGLLPSEWKREPSAFSDMHVMPWKKAGATIIELASKTALADTVARFRNHANVVYLPFPRIVAGTDGLSPVALALHNALVPPMAMNIDGDSMEFFGMAFDREQLHRAAQDLARVQPQKSRAPSLARR